MTQSSQNTIKVQTREAILRLLEVAQRDTGQSRRCANFLLAWWNAEFNGGFDLTDSWSCDLQIRKDMLTVFHYILVHNDYPTEFGLCDDFEALVRLWRSSPKTPRKRRL